MNESPKTTNGFFKKLILWSLPLACLLLLGVAAFPFYQNYRIVKMAETMPGGFTTEKIGPFWVHEKIYVWFDVVDFSPLVHVVRYDNNPYYEGCGYGERIDPKEYPLDSDGMQKLMQFKDLENLNLYFDENKHADLVHLRHLSNLKILSISGGDYSKLEEDYFSNFTNLHSLDLSFEEVTDKEVVALSCLLELESLDLSGTEITDAGLQCIKKMPRLSNLNLSKTKISDHGVKELAILSQLVFLNLNYTRITDASAEHLKQIKSLKSLALFDTQITKNVQQEIKESLPNVH